MEPSYWVVAEIAEMRVAAKGHCYMELVDKSPESDEVTAKAKANIWSYSYRSISGWFESVTGQTLRPGMQILANVQVQYHELYGLSLNVKDIDPNFTLGERIKQKVKTIERLKSDGIFDMNKGLSLPVVPQNVAVISAAGAAGYGDFMSHLENNPYLYQVNCQLYAASMQGNEAPESIMKALHQIMTSENTIDLVVIIRGGGAQVDLDCFDQYDLCAHIAQFPLPVVTGIGHERDQSIADMVAHTAMKTPTAVADFILKGFEAYESKLILLLDQIDAIFENRMQEEQHKLQLISSSMKLMSLRILKESEMQLTQLDKELQRNSALLLKSANQKIDSLTNKIRVMDPQYLFKKGYSYTSIDGLPLHLWQEGDKKAELLTINHRLKIKSKITEIEKRNE